jgi:hypothetical protein
MAIFAKGVELDNGLKADLYITGAYITTLRGGKAAAARFEGFASREHSLSPQNAVWGLEVEFTPKGGELWEEAYTALIENPFPVPLPANDSDLALEAVPSIPTDEELNAGIYEGESEDDRLAAIAERRARFERRRSDVEARNAERAYEIAARAERRAMFATAKRV